MPSKNICDLYDIILSHLAYIHARKRDNYILPEFIRLLVEILEPRPRERIYDPCCGFGEMLIILYKFVERNYGRDEASKLFIFGQEVNPRVMVNCKLNLYIHGIRNADTQLGNTLLYPRHPLGFADLVLCNPPQRQMGYDEYLFKAGHLWRERFKYGFTPEESAAWAWIQHIIAAAKSENGRIGVFVRLGCLLGSYKERAIMQKIVEDDLVDCVILLPKNPFYKIFFKTTVIILRKSKPVERKGKILFINVSNEHVEHPTFKGENKLSDKYIKCIAKVYKNFKDVEGFVKIASLEDVRSNDYCLSPELHTQKKR